MLKLKDYLKKFNQSDIIEIKFAYKDTSDIYERTFVDSVENFMNNTLAESNVLRYSDDNILLNEKKIKAMFKVCFAEYVLTDEFLAPKFYIDKYAIKKIEIDEDIVLFNYPENSKMNITEELKECNDFDDFKCSIDSNGEDYYDFSKREKILTTEELENLVGKKNFKSNIGSTSIELLDEDPEKFIKDFIEEENGKYKFYMRADVYSPIVYDAIDLLDKNFNNILEIDGYTIKDTEETSKCDLVLQGYKSSETSERLIGVFQVNNEDKYMLLDLGYLEPNLVDLDNIYPGDSLRKSYTLKQLEESLNEKCEIVWFNEPRR
ncbi:hypothetical protein B5F20_09530 [Clostridium perfringens]|uniref:hypothetical protein n=1 Tax=Clostridium perfringens TaxID=1502 RepID=UPI000B365164|nr:hypothetical protein [Clostridium perfringens]OUP46200.1 hypothetical protein B5F20_09530 [Clostridium perfringens]